jgi:putative hydrolases of HD superfamily
MNSADLYGILQFLTAAGQLKDTLRNAWTAGGAQESAAEHSWRLALFAVLVAGNVPNINLERLLKICLVHDLGEAIGGDIPAVDQVNTPDKAAKERADFILLLQPLPGQLQSELLALWDEYDAAITPEARLAKGLDKLETILTHNTGQNPPGFDYGFNLKYGSAYTSSPPLLAQFRETLDAMTRGRMDAPCRN